MTFDCVRSQQFDQLTDPFDPIPLSALQHWSYCPRQCALIHQEQAFSENVHTARGQAVHARVDTPGFETQGDSRSVRALPLFSDRLGLTGKADIVEFLADGTPYPVEYKHGPRREREHDDIQLTAQAICLEEMTSKAIHRGAIYHATSRRRREVIFTEELRAKVEQVVAAVRGMLASGVIPPPVNDKRCRECSLLDICQPSAVAAASRLSVLRHELFLIEECSK